MTKALKFLLGLCLFLSFVFPSQAIIYVRSTSEGTVTLSDQSAGSDVNVCLFNWESTTGGSATAITTPVHGELLSVTFKPWTETTGPTPTNGYDVTLTDDDGFDVLCNQGADLSNATTTSYSILLGNAAATSFIHPPVAGRLTLNVDGAGDTKKGFMRLRWRSE